MFNSTLAKKLMKKTEDDVSSLRAVKDSESQHTSHTVRSQESSLSGVSRTFDFDGDVVSSRAYRNAMTSLMRRKVTAQSKQNRSESPNIKVDPTTKHIDSLLPSKTLASNRAYDPHLHIALREFEQLRTDLAEAGNADGLASLQNNSCLSEIPHRTFPWCLRRAIDHGFVECVAALLQHGTELEATDAFAQTPFLYSCWVGQVKVAVYLHKQGAKIETKNSAGETPLHIASQRQDLEMINNLLDWGADVDCKDTRGDSPLHLAALLRDGTAATILLARGATIQTKNSRGETPFTQALLAPNPAIISTFLTHSTVADSVKAQVETYVSLLVAKILTEEDEVQQIASFPSDPNAKPHLHTSTARLRALVQCLDILLSTLSYSPTRFASILNRSMFLRACFLDVPFAAKRALTSVGKDLDITTLDWLASASAEAISACLQGLHSTPAPRRTFLLRRPKPKATIAEILAEEPQPVSSFGQDIRVEITTQVEVGQVENRWAARRDEAERRDDDELALRAAGYASSSSRASSPLVSVGM